jgi:hypothetical protein
MMAPTMLPPSNTPGTAAATDTVVGLNALPNSQGTAVVPHGPGELATPSKAPPPEGHATMRQLQAPGTTSPVTQEDVVTWFG